MFRIGRLELSGNGVQFGLRLLHRHVLFEAAKNKDESLAAYRLRLVDLQRSDEVDLIAEETKILGENSDDGDRLLIQNQSFSDHVGIIVELALPEAVSDHNYRGP